MIKSKHIQQAFGGFVHFCGVGGVGISWLGHMLKEPTHIQAHLVFADTQSPNKKPKELEFLPTLGRHRKEKV